MSDLWMISTGGRAIKVDDSQLSDLQAKDWKVYPLSKMKDGEPSTKYFPQFDVRNSNKSVKYVDFDELSEVLIVEVI